MHTISLTIGWNLTKLAQIHHQDVGKKLLDFGDTVHSNTQKVSLVNAVKVCVHTISLTNGWNLTKLSQIHHKDGDLDFGDLDLIFKVTAL